MSATKTLKTAYYLRARHGKKTFDIQATTAKARKKQGTAGESEVELGGGDVVRIQHYKQSKGKLFVHLVRYMPGLAASTLEPNAAAEEDDEGAQFAPKGKEFKDGDCFLLINGCDVIYCGHGISQAKMTVYLAQFFRKAKLNDESEGFELRPATNIAKLELLQKHGVRSVQLATNAFAISLPKAQRKHLIAKALGAIGDEFGALVKRDSLASEQKAMEDLLVNVEVRLDGNTYAVDGAQDYIKELAEQTIDEKDAPISEFTIETQSGEKISSSEVRLQAHIKVERKDNSVNHVSVWNEMEAYFDVLSGGKLLD